MSRPRSTVGKPDVGSTRTWSGVLGGLEWVAYPAMAGLAAALLSLGVVTWVPALAALARTLDRWRSEGDAAVFTGVFRDFAQTWRRLWKVGVAIGLSFVLTAVDLSFLLARDGTIALVLAGLLVGLAAVLVTYAHGLALADMTGAERLYRAGASIAFGVPGIAVFGVWLGLSIVTLPLGIGPALFASSVALLIGRWLLRRQAGE